VPFLRPDPRTRRNDTAQSDRTVHGPFGSGREIAGTALKTLSVGVGLLLQSSRRLLAQDIDSSATAS
jgi:hypothetical protein